jgi:type IV pilus assembly protein PilB
MSSFRERLSELLVSKGLLTREQLSSLLREAGEQGMSFTRLLIGHKVMTEEALVGLLAEGMQIPTLSLAKYRVDPAVANLIPERLARQYAVIPLSKFGERVIVAMADPLNLMALDDLKMLTQYAVDPVLVPEAEIRHAIEQIYAPSSALAGALEDGASSETPTEKAETGDEESTVDLVISEGEGEAPIIKAINQMIREALRKRASDIHLEPLEQGLRVRYRIDGRLAQTHQFPKEVQNTVLTRLKIMAGLDITEWRLPQDGRFKVRLEGQEVDFRVSVLPITHGGKVVLRALDKAQLSAGLDRLGFLPESVTPLTEAVKRPHGMILVTGPTGSGKSTTLYAVLTQLNESTRSLITIEDPVEYQVEGITQVPVNPDIGLTFAAGLRAILRQNPDVVMVGEIRDFETADIAMKASLTGHLVLSTLHTNDTASAVTRLIDMGVEPFLVASSIVVIEAQRLARTLCRKCREPFKPPAELLQRLGYAPPQGATFYTAKGCSACRETGYRGRLGVIEILPVDEPIRNLIVSQAPSWDIKRDAIERLGMKTLREDGLRKAAMGLTSLEEVLHVTSDE